MSRSPDPASTAISATGLRRPNAPGQLTGLKQPHLEQTAQAFWNRNFRRNRIAGACAAFFLAFAPSPASAGEADVIAAKVRKTGAATYNFDVTIRSNDRGWNYYCDRFEVLTLDGKLLGARTLFHPHENEQPFTRDLYNVRVPAGIMKVRVRARHKPKGYDGKTLDVTLPK